MKNSSLVFQGFLHALGVLAYVTAVALFFFNAKTLFNGPDTFLAPVTMLLLLVFSATIAGVLVLGRPIYFYFNGKKTEAIKLLFITAAWLFLMILSVLAVQISW